MHTLGHFFNIDSQLITPSDAQKLAAILDPKAFIGALYSPGDGYADPTGYVNALVKGAVQNGGQLIEECPVTNILTEETNGNRKVVGVETPNGKIRTSVVVNCGGVWARNVSQLVGLELPITTFKHAYVLTGTIPEAKGSPCIRDHDGGIYIRPQGDSLILGGYENNPIMIKDV